MIRGFRKLPGPVRVLAGVEAGLKLVALFQAVRGRQLRWAIAILIVNSAGVLPVVYLLRYQRPRSAASV